MDNKKYLDKVVDYMVRSTKIDYENESIDPPFPPNITFPFFLLTYLIFFPPNPSPSYFSLSKYCKNMFGLTEEEIEYVWEKYKSIILDKIN